MWGFITTYLNSVSNSGFNFVPVFLGAIILWNFLIRVQQGTILGFFEDVWSRNFLNLFASPLTVGEYITGLVLTCMVTSAAGLVVMLVLAGLAFGFLLLQFGSLLIPFILILFLFGLALGVFTAGVVLRFGPSAEWLAWPVPFLLAPFAGVFYPVAVLPASMQFVSKLVPASYVFENMRNFISGSPVDMTGLIVGIVLSLMYLMLSYHFFVRIYRRALRSGLLTHFGGEEG